ncbi:MAG: DUF4038 domain-containing protein [Candidatus Omnitrophica bacterium]|nr:DUF4038 domain-containing protein [Candidatus Omnitrophota bacterium]
MSRQTGINRVVEFTFVAKEKFSPESIEFSARFVSPSGKIINVPGFWDGKDIWKIRYSSNEPGIHTFETACDPEIKGLSQQKGSCSIVKPKKEENPLYKHGFPFVKEGKIVYADGKNFFWLGDTWWMGLCKRLDKNGFKTLAQDRINKGFTVVQIVAGLYPDMNWYDHRGKGDGGFPYSKDFSKLNPDYFRSADWRICHLCDCGIVPCIVGAWGYYIHWTGIEKMKRHWKNIIARWSAYPVIWCIAGETIMPYYLSDKRDQDKEFQKRAWTDVAQYIRDIDPFKHPITTHPTHLGHEQLEKPEILDINMLQTGHGSHTSFEDTWSFIRKAKEAFPLKPVVVGEVNYEGIGEACREEIQRICFWGSLLSGAYGYTYGANGIWQINTEKKPYGPSPRGRSWGDTPWQSAYKLPGSQHVATGKKILEKTGWPDFVPCREKIACEKENDCIFAAEIPEKIMVIYAGPNAFNLAGIKAIKGLSPGKEYLFAFVNPKDARIVKKFTITTNRQGEWALPKNYWSMVPVFQDWVITLKKK